MNELWNDCRRSVLRHAKDDAQRATMARHLGLVEPFFLLLGGERRLATRDEVTASVTMLQLAKVARLPHDEPVRVVAHPWSAYRDLPSEPTAYAIYFSTLFLNETLLAFQSYTDAAYYEVQNFFIKRAGASAFQNLLCHGGPELISYLASDLTNSVARGITSVGSLSLLYALHGHQEGLARLAPYARFMAQVMPIGVLHADQALHVLCDG